MLKDHKIIVFGIEHYTALGLVRSLGEEGVFPDLIAIKGKAPVVSSSKYVAKAHFVESVEEGYEVLIREYGNVADSGRLPVIYCSDDRTEGYLDLHYDELKDRFVFMNAHARGRVSEFMDKCRILDCAKRHGLNVLETVQCRRGEIPEGIPYPVITKSISPNVGGWKADVHICESEEDLRAAYRHIQADTVLVQKYIEKKNELCLDGLAVAKGTKLWIPQATTYNYLIRGYYSPYMTATNFDNPEVYGSLKGMFEEIGFDGIFSAEFLIDKDDALYFSEINFRTSTWCWISTKMGMNLPAVWGESMLTGKIPENIDKSFPDNCTAMVEPIDYGKRVGTGMATPGRWLADFRDAKVTYYYDKDDMEPFMVMMENWGKLL